MEPPPNEPTDTTRLSDEPPRVDLTTIESDRLRATEGAKGDDAIDPLEVFGQPRVGEEFFGKYKVERKIGEGGMGTVWLVRHIALKAPRALKLIVSGIASDPMFRSRFLREARAMARLTHPNAVVVHDVRIGRESAFIEMEYIKGVSLNQVLKPGVPMPLDWVLRIAEQLCDVLHEAHKEQIVHRDLKPSNMMLVDDRPAGKELLKVLDFGIAKMLGPEGKTEVDPADNDVRTTRGIFVGSAPWSSPEQAYGEEVDTRSDLYSVGIILYELLTGSRPFNGPSILYDHRHTPPPPFAKTNPAISLPPALEQVVLRCLAKKPGDRPQTARDLAADFLWAATDGKGTPSGSGSTPSRTPLPADHVRTEADFESPATPTFGPVALLPATDRPGPVSTTQPQTAPLTRLDHPQPAPGSQAGATTLEAEVATERNAGTAVKRPWAVGWPRLVFGTAVLVLALVWAALGRRGDIDDRLKAYRPDGDSPLAALVRIKDKTRFILIKGGEFTMGNDGFDASGQPTDEDRPAHRVTLSDFYLQETEVTNGEMDAYFVEHKTDRSMRPPRFQEAWNLIEKAGRDPRPFPAVGISHALAEEYARWVQGKLPTEAQWEYAARSRGQPMRFVWEGDDKPSHKNANIASIGDHALLTTAEARTFFKDKTEQGIYDLTGNVREWCRERWGPYTESRNRVLDPVGPRSPASADFVVRGGSFASYADRFRTTRPRRVEPVENPTAEQLAEDQTAYDLGFRIVIEWPSPR